MVRDGLCEQNNFELNDAAEPAMRIRTIGSTKALMWQKLYMFQTEGRPLVTTA